MKNKRINLQHNLAVIQIGFRLEFSNEQIYSSKKKKYSAIDEAILSRIMFNKFVV